MAAPVQAAAGALAVSLAKQSVPGAASLLSLSCAAAEWEAQRALLVGGVRAGVVAGSGVVEPGAPGSGVFTLWTPPRAAAADAAGPRWLSVVLRGAGSPRRGGPPARFACRVLGAAGSRARFGWATADGLRALHSDEQPAGTAPGTWAVAAAGAGGSWLSGGAGAQGEAEASAEWEAGAQVTLSLSISETGMYVAQRLPAFTPPFGKPYGSRDPARA